MKGRICLILALHLFVWGTVTCFAQNQKLADSLVKQLNHLGATTDTLRFYWLSEISFNHNNPDSSLYYARLIGRETNDPYWLHQARYNEGSALRMQGNLDGALEAYFQSLEYARKGNLLKKEGMSYMAIGDVYSVSGAHQNSIEYYSKSITILRQINDSLNLATAIFNVGDEYLNRDSLDAAIPYFLESARIFEFLNYPSGKAYNLGNIGMVYAKKGNDALAMTNMDNAIAILEDLQDHYAISVYLTYMSDIYLKRGEAATALGYAERGLELAKRYGLKDEMSAANFRLSEIHEQTGNVETAYNYYKAYIAYRDSVKNIASVQQMADLRTNFEVSQKQVEVDLLNQQKKTQRIVVLATSIALLLIGLLAVGLYRRNKFIRKTKRIIEEEKRRSEELLLNILPEETALELKENGRVVAKKFESVTVLFTDFKDFTISAERVSPELLVESIDYYFKAFDAITTKYDLEKIKTVGDSYMCAGGLPLESQDHAIHIVQAAKEMANFVKQEEQSNSNRLHFEIRIGIHSGPVVAGIVGDKKWQYDIWGDTVNIASRMESNSAPGKINLSETTYQCITPLYKCKYRGEIEVKNRGRLKMYFLEG